jgi:SAM-dependent methyltransferase
VPRDGRDPFAEVAARLAPHPQSGGRWLSGYARSKLRLDPLYRAALPWIPARTKVLDLGCGVGLLGLLLEARNQDNEVHGIEWDAAKAGFAQARAAVSPRIQVECADLFEVPWPPSEVVALLDVIHYFPAARQRDLLLRIGSHLPEGGRLLLRVMDAGAVGVARFTRLCGRAAVRFGWNRAARVHWRPLAAVEADLRDAGLTILPMTEPEDRAHGNQFLVGEKRREISPA